MSLEQKHALYFSLCASAAVFAVVHVLAEICRARVLWYYPLERRWAFERDPSGVGMAWYGRTVLAAGTAMAAFGACYVATRSRAAARAAGHRTWAACMTAAVVVSLALYIWGMVDRDPVPEPLPEGYPTVCSAPAAFLRALALGDP